MRKTLKQLQDRRAEVTTGLRALLDAPAGDEGRLSAEQETQYQTLEAELQLVKTALAREERLQEEERQAAAGITRITGVHNNEEDRRFASLAEQLVAVAAAQSPAGTMVAGIPGGTVDPRLFGAASGANTSVGADGGFLVRKDFAADLFKEAFENGALASRCDDREVSATSDGLEVVYVDETSRADGSQWGGVTVYRRNEADTVTASRPKVGKWECRLEDMMGLAYMTGRTMQDAPAMAGLFRDSFTDVMSFKLDDEIYRGDGVGKCLGVLNSGALVTIAKEAGQPADTIVTENVQKMWAAVLPRSKTRGAWFVNSETFPQLQSMNIGVGAGGQLVYLPPGGLSSAPFGMLYGRPVVEIEQASALGDVGDIAYLDLSRYALLRKGGTQQDESIHVRFLYNELTFRWIARVNGAPKLKSAITPFKGSQSRSAFVTLAAR